MNEMGPFIMFVLFCSSAVATSDGRLLGPHDNVYCQARPAVVAVDPVNHHSFPIYVKLHRCEGSISHIQPSVLKCAPKSYSDVHVLNLFTQKTITLKNHTKCGSACAKSSCDSSSLQHFNSSTCECECKYKNGPPTPCAQGFMWSAQKCKCRCNKVPDVCTVGKVWSHETCSCECNKSSINQQCRRKEILDQNTCKCVVRSATLRQNQQSNSNTHMFITLLVLETVVIAILVTALIHWVRKKRPVESTNHKVPVQDFRKPLTSEDNEYNYGSDSGQ